MALKIIKLLVTVAIICGIGVESEDVLAAAVKSDDVHSGSGSEFSASIHKKDLAPVRTLEDTTENRVFGGEDAEPGEFPFYVLWPTQSGKVLCGASLIHDDIVLTAAHCIEADETPADSVIIGAYFLESVDENTEVRQIEAQRVHPGWNNKTKVYDVMVLKITSPSLKPTISLNDDSSSPSDGKEVTGIGLGDTDTNPFDMTFADILQKVNVQVVPHEQCALFFSFLFLIFPPIVENVMLCAGVKEGRKDTCQGDSGGPLLELRDGEYVQVGITSFGTHCIVAKSPGVYTRVSAVKGWIDEMICDLSDNPPASCGSEPMKGPAKEPTKEQGKGKRQGNGKRYLKGKRQEG